MFGSARAYSTHTLGYIRSKAGSVSVLAPLPKQQLEIFAQLKQNDRREAFEKVKSAILFDQLNAQNRNLVFKANRAAALESSEEPKYFDMGLGSKTERIELKPRKYLGPPSRQDFRVLVTTSHSAEDVDEALSYLHECLKSKELGHNFESELGGFLLKRAAAAGNFASVFHQLTANPVSFKNILKQDFYTEALRLYALRIPFLSHRSKNMLNKLYSRSSTGISRHLAYAYGLVQYKNKFGEEHMGRLPEVIKEIQDKLPPVQARPRASMKAISQVDLVLAHEAMKDCDLPGAKQVADAITEVMDNTARNRPLSEAVTVKIDQAEEGEEDSAEN